MTNGKIVSPELVVAIKLTSKIINASVIGLGIPLTGSTYCVLGFQYLEYFVLVPFVGVSAVLGLGADTTKVSISMQLLEYLNYDSTVLTYFASFSASLSYLIYLVVTNQSKLIDLDMILLLYAYIIIWTDVGNYFN